MMARQLVVLSGVCLLSGGFAGPCPGQDAPGPQPSLFAPGIVSTGAHELDITLTPDGRDVFFTRAGPDWTSMILTLRRSDDGWSNPAVASFARGREAIYPFVAPDGQSVVFDCRDALASSDQQDGNSNLYVSERVNGGWGPGRPFDGTINTDRNEMFGSLTLGGHLYFSSDRDGSLGGFDIYGSVAGEGGYAPPLNLGPAVNSAANEFHAFVSPGEDYVLFDSDRPGGFGRNDLYVSFRAADNAWTPAVNLGERVNTAASESRPYVSPDGRSLFFCSNRAAAAGANDPADYEAFMNRIDGPGNGNQDIYWMEAEIIDDLRSSLGDSLD